MDIDIIRKGWIYKKSRYLKQWRRYTYIMYRRWCILTDSYILTYVSSNVCSIQPTECIPIDIIIGIKHSDDHTHVDHSFVYYT